MKFRLLKSDEIEARLSRVTKKGCSLLLYKDARCDMNILDETVGVENWQRNHQLIDGQLFCSVGIYVESRNEWIWKQDVGTESYTEKEKGRASDSFKRACFNLGIGRELYTAPFIWFPSSQLKKHEEMAGGKWTCRDTFTVEEITYYGRKIKSVTIRNISTGGLSTFKTNAKPVDGESAETDPAETSTPTDTQIKNLKTVIEKHGLNTAGVLLKAGLTTLENITSAEYNKVVKIVRAEAEERKKANSEPDR